MKYIVSKSIRYIDPRLFFEGDEGVDCILPCIMHTVFAQICERKNKNVHYTWVVVKH